MEHVNSLNILGVTKLRIADSGTSGTSGSPIFFKKKKTKKTRLFKTFNYKKDCDKILSANTEKIFQLKPTTFPR